LLMTASNYNYYYGKVGSMSITLPTIVVTGVTTLERNVHA